MNKLFETLPDYEGGYLRRAKQDEAESYKTESERIKKRIAAGAESLEDIIYDEQQKVAKAEIRAIFSSDVTARERAQGYWSAVELIKNSLSDSKPLLGGAQEQVLEKIKIEYEQYRREILSKSKEEIFASGEKNHYFDTIKDYFDTCSERTSDWEYEILNQHGKPLEFLYDNYINGTNNSLQSIGDISEYLDSFFESYARRDERISTQSGKRGAEM